MPIGDYVYSQDRKSGDTRSLVFLLDVDNTLLDNDRLKSDISVKLEAVLGADSTSRFWELYEMVRKEEDFVDYPTTIQRFAAGTCDQNLVARLTDLLNAMDFRSYLFPGALDTIVHLRDLGTVAILSDGDSVFQPEKISRSGLSEAVNGNVLIYVHKERELPRVFARFPGDHYVMVDDKPGILAALEQECPTTFTTVLVLQGKYARMTDYSPKPDWVVPHIGDLQKFTAEQFLPAATGGH